jgi:hypothetical protein
VLAGRIFVASMLVMAAGAAYLGVIKHQPGNVGGGIFTFYLILTAWLTARRAEGQTSKLDWVALLIPSVLGILSWMNGIQVVRSGASSQAGVPVGMIFLMGSVQLLAAAGDMRMLMGGGVLGAKRIARHLWRMCAGLFFAAASFFLGQQKVMPQFMHGSPILWILGLAPLGSMIFWLIRVRMGHRFRPQTAAA